MSHVPAIVGTSAKSKARPAAIDEDHVSEQLSDDDWSPSHLLSEGEDAEPELAPGEERSELTCGICLQPHGEDAVEALECGHVFHSECLDKWWKTASPAPEAGDCPNRCHTFVHRQHQPATIVQEEEDERAFDAEMMELFG